ncbi:MAG: phospholipase A [Bacteroidales bacterium]
MKISPRYVACLCFFTLVYCFVFSQDYNKEIDKYKRGRVERKEMVEKMIKDLRKGVIVTNPDSIVEILDKLPSFSIYKDNYIATGIQLDHSPTPTTSDAKFQLSFRQRITKSKLLWDTHLFLTYTQINYWDIYRKSAPFRELNYNPTLALGKHIIYNNRLIGYTTLQFEHQSNGLDEEGSRDMNVLTLCFIHFFNDQLQTFIKGTAPLVMGKYTNGLFYYRGYVKYGFDWSSKNRRIITSAMFEKRARVDLSHNIQLDFSYRLNKLDNIYLFVQWYNGYGEALTPYREHTNSLRIGITMRGDLFNYH